MMVFSQDKFHSFVMLFQAQICQDLKLATRLGHKKAATELEFAPNYLNPHTFHFSYHIQYLVLTGLPTSWTL